MTAVEKYEAPDFPVLMQQAEMLAKSNMIPQHFRGKPGDVIAAMLLGQELGLGPMATMAHVVVINGSASLNAEGKVALVRKNGHSISGESTSTAARVTGKRRDTGDEMCVEWTMKMAERAGLLKNPTWRQYPEAMLWSRAVSQLCRMLFPDVLAGLSYTEEELQSFAGVAGREAEGDDSRASSLRPTSGPANVDEETGEIVEAEIVIDGGTVTTQPKRRVRKPPVAAVPPAEEPTQEEQLAQVEKARDLLAMSEKQSEVKAAIDMIGNVKVRRAIGDDFKEMFSGRRIPDLNDDECEMALNLIREHVATEAKPKPERVRSAPVQKIKDYLEDDPERPFEEPEQPMLGGDDAA